MKHSARILAFVLILIVFALSATGCGLDGFSGALRSASTGSNAPSGNSASSTSSSTVTIAEAVIFNQNGIKITAKSLDMKDSIFGPEIKMLIENDGEKPVTVQVRDASVNGYMVGTVMSASVTPGKKANQGLTLMKSDLNAAGITTIANVEFRFRIFDSETLDTVLDSDFVKIETSAAEGFTYTYDNSGVQAYNANGVEIVVKGVDEDGSSLGQEVLVYIYNSTNRSITVQTRGESVNGFMVSGLFSCTVAPGKHAVDGITFLNSRLEENGIEKIESIELYFHIFNQDTWTAIADSDPITVQFD